MQGASVVASGTPSYAFVCKCSAMYLGNTEYRIHGTNQPSTIGSFVSSGCIRLTNDDVEDLYSRVTIGTTVIVLPGANTAASQLRPK